MVLERAALCRLTGMWIRLKLMAPFQRPRAPRPRLGLSPSSPLPFFFRLAMAALRLHHLRLARHGRAANLLLQRGTILLARRRELDPLPGGDGLVDGLDDGHVDEPFLAGRLGSAVA